MVAMTFLPLSRKVARAILPTLAVAASMPMATIQAQDTNRVSASLLRVLGEVADVYRTGRPVFLVADYRFPHRVIGRFPQTGATTNTARARRQAEQLQADSGSSFGVFGPYVTAQDPPDTTTSRIADVILVWQTPRGRVQRRLDPEVDALFLTMSAVDKFMIPYYDRLYGPRYAQDLRAAIVIRRKPCHLGTNACFPHPDGSVTTIPVMQPAGQPGGGPVTGRP
jgi:hypothetical protein